MLYEVITNRRILVIESDDWGSVRMPSTQAFKRLEEAGLDLMGPLRLDLVAHEEDSVDPLGRLGEETNRRIRSTLGLSDGWPIVITSYSIHYTKLYEV